MPAAFKAPNNVDRRLGLTTTLYFVATPSRPTWLKIGLAKDLKKRLHVFRLGNPDIALRASRTIPRPYDRQIERLIHSALADRAQSREWFEVTLAEALAVAMPIIAQAVTAARALERSEGYWRQPRPRTA